MDTAVGLSSADQVLDLANIRSTLIRLEDTITVYLIERVQFPLNRSIYVPGAIPVPDSPLSFLDWLLCEEEKVHSRVRRYQAPDEYPFFPEALLEPILKPLNYPAVLHPNDVNVNERLKNIYINNILPHVCAKVDGKEEESTQHFGSTAMNDISCLQALSRRIHYGKFVAESKFRKETDRFVKLIKDEDRKGIDDAITDAAVEKKVLERLRKKATNYGNDPENPTATPPKINVDAVVAMYKDYVIPLTKEVEVEYLMQRLKGTQWE
ncbi:Chorismate mutase AroQ class eukaryotic type [Macrophomina phaseolina MS6]|uniref:Chorismate mutase n=2 Tax=Macrophomina phaseolina TaxID=35725 RepID=K2S819_MACPH|nr:Chorismate mutase AroQ class eukaryotic type [Macrophomina phaseolina MS6]KAH7030156.1 chorismate mutase [Macrophomina phaseolina]